MHMRGGGRTSLCWVRELLQTAHQDADVPTLHKRSCMGILAVLHDSPVKLFSTKIKRTNV